MNNIANATVPLTVKSPVRGPANRVLQTAGWLMILTSLTACRAPKVISAEQVAVRVEARQTFTAPCDGWFLSDALYQRTRRAVADRILELQPAP